LAGSSSWRLIGGLEPRTCGRRGGIGIGDLLLLPLPIEQEACATKHHEHQDKDNADLERSEQILSNVL
jgi:hypothetical protein